MNDTRMTDLPSLAARIFNTPLLIEPGKAAVILNVLAPRLFGGLSPDIRIPQGSADAAAASEPRMSFLTDDVYRGLRQRPGEGYSNINGVAVIPVTGTLVRRGAWTGASSGLTSYEGISAQLRAAADDTAVRAIALEIDSFGGEAMGVFDLARDIRMVRESKPVWAFVSHYALSAGYAIAAQATRIVAPDLAKVGSIGVVMMHADYSRKLDEDGVAVTLIHSGARKVDANPYEPLPENVRDALQTESDRLRLRFAQEVEEGRQGAISAVDALRTEAGVFQAEDALARGLIDQIGDLREVFAELAEGGAGVVRPMSRGAARAGLSAQVTEIAASADGACATTSPVSPAVHGSSGCEPGAQAPEPKETGMKDTDITAPDAEQPKAATTTVASAPDNDATRADAQATERARSAKILQKCEAAGLDMGFAQKLIASDMSLEQVFEKIIDAKAARAQDGGDIVNAVARTVITGDAVDRSREGIVKALSARARLDGGERNEFSGYSLKELARHTLQVRGLRVPGGSSMELVGAAFVPSLAGGMHGTSDFGNILADVARKSMLRGFDEAVEVFEQFTSVGNMSDFKAHRRVGLDAFPTLAKVEPGAEFQYGTMGDHGESAILATFGRLVSINRQAIINDDLDAFTRIPAAAGRAARRTVGDLVFAVLSGNPLMSDGTALFAAGHGNLAGSASGPSELAINAAITAMARQKDRSANASALNIAPRFLVGPPEVRAQALQSLNSEYAPDDTDKAGTAKQPRAHNTVRDAATPLFDARLAGNGAWFLLADPAQFDTIEVGYLDGVSTPYLEQQDGWTVDGVELKVRLDATATPLAWEGMYKVPLS